MNCLNNRRSKASFPPGAGSARRRICSGTRTDLLSQIERTAKKKRTRKRSAPYFLKDPRHFLISLFQWNSVRIKRNLQTVAIIFFKIKGWRSEIGDCQISDALPPRQSPQESPGVASSGLLFLSFGVIDHLETVGLHSLRSLFTI